MINNMYKFIEVIPCKNNIGALINTNLNEANNYIINKIKAALDEFGVVFFRNQNFEKIVLFALNDGPS